jgi:t-SNARE complex subunit (syntaxin)
MNIKEEYKKELKAIVNRYAEIHIEIKKLEEEMLKLVDSKNDVSTELLNLRDSEISLINKIEEDLGEKLTQDFLTEIVNS